MTTYLALVHTDAPDNYGISFPDLPGCVSAGDTLEDVIANGGDAATFHLEGMAEDGIPTPRPRTLHELRRDEEFQALIGEAIVVPVRVPETAAA